MRKLNRDDAAVPGCLAEFRPGMHNWDDIGPRTAEIRICLEQMQGRRCAYCEGSLDTLGQHIEHFRRKHQGHFPQLIFTWSNLYWSCDKHDSCGHHKDNGAGTYDINDLMDPCVDDPDHFLRFRLDGTISIRHGLSGAEIRKARETLRVFNLNPDWGRLRNMRRAVLAGYEGTADESSGLTREELRELFEAELAATKHLPFSTAIRHVLTEP
jgi:uncharacterized protein (TIGR02646 family)